MQSTGFATWGTTEMPVQPTSVPIVPTGLDETQAKIESAIVEINADGEPVPAATPEPATPSAPLDTAPQPAPLPVLSEPELVEARQKMPDKEFARVVAVARLGEAIRDHGPQSYEAERARQQVAQDAAQWFDEEILKRVPDAASDSVIRVTQDYANSEGISLVEAVRSGDPEQVARIIESARQWQSDNDANARTRAEQKAEKARRRALASTPVQPDPAKLYAQQQRTGGIHDTRKLLEVLLDD